MFQLLNRLFKKKSGLLQIITVNASILVNIKKNIRLEDLTKNAHSAIVCDGQPIVWASKLFGNPLPERVSGYDLFHSILKNANKKQAIKIFLMGSNDSTIKKVIRKIEIDYPNITIVGYHHGFFREEQQEIIFNEIEKSMPDLIFIGMGSPKQEFLINDFTEYSKLNGVAIGIGGTFEVYTGNLKRAPLIFQKLGMEWAYRLLQEPRRLFKRYLISNSKFILLTFLEFLNTRITKRN